MKVNRNNAYIEKIMLECLKLDWKKKQLEYIRANVMNELTQTRKDKIRSLKIILK